MSNKNKPLFSIIIPTLNEEKYLPRLLQDLTNQTFTNFQVLHIDGNSDDQTQTKAQHFADQLPSFTQITTKTRHVSFQRNLGAKQAQGKYLLFIDADTQLPPYFLQGLSFQLQRQPTDMFTTWSIPDSKKPGDKALITITNLTLETARLLDYPHAIGVLMGCTAPAFKIIGGFDENVDYAEDSDFVKTGFKKGLSFKIYHQPRFIYSLRRFRSEGTLPTLRQLAKKKLHEITNGLTSPPKGYPMGGQAFEEKTPTRRFFQQINQLFAHSNKPKIKQFLKDLLTAEKLDF